MCDISLYVMLSPSSGSNFIQLLTTPASNYPALGQLKETCHSIYPYIASETCHYIYPYITSETCHSLYLYITSETCHSISIHYTIRDLSLYISIHYIRDLPLYISSLCSSSSLECCLSPVPQTGCDRLYAPVHH